MSSRVGPLLVVTLVSLTLGALSSTSCKSITGSDCSQYKIECGKVQNGVEVVGGIVPEKCGCPSNTDFAGTDKITAGGPYDMCTCR